jgi:hypothetical protein
LADRARARDTYFKPLALPVRANRFIVSPKVEAETKRPREGLKPPSRRVSSFQAPKELCYCRRCAFRRRVSAFQSIRFMKRLLKRAPAIVSLRFKL